MMIPSNDFKVRDPKAEEALRAIGEILRTTMPAGYGFVLLIASIGEGGNTFYTSNCERDSVIAMMREFMEKFEPN